MTYLDKINQPADLKTLNISELSLLAEEIRQEIITTVSRQGGHLASSLGAVEITLAWHYVFDSPKDQIVWDVGHQSYAHKLISGRRESFSSLRALGGLSGFPKCSESEHDAFETGHSATSISAALGLAQAKRLQGEKGLVTAVIGDGAMTGGLSFEAINHAGHMGASVLVILNDNDMSIDQNVGALSRQLNRLRTGPAYLSFKETASRVIEKIPLLGRPLRRGLEKIKDTLKYFFISGIFFEELGFTYVGPAQGHDLASMVSQLERIKGMEGPVLWHVKTQKGRGFVPACQHPENFHGVGAFDPKNGQTNGQTSGKKSLSYTQAFSAALLSLADQEERLLAITAAMAQGTGLAAFKEAYPDRFFDVGIAEQHAVTLAAGLAKGGLRPLVAIYATFMQRAVDQVIHDVCMQKLPVLFCVDRAGLVGKDGQTHQGLLDLAIYMTVPHLEIWLPADRRDMEEMLAYALKKEGPLMLRYPRDKVPEENFPRQHAEDPFHQVHAGSDLLILASGDCLDRAHKAYQLLEKEGKAGRLGLMGLRQVKPFPKKALRELARPYKTVVFIEETTASGGISAYVRQALGKDQVFVSRTLPDDFIEHGCQADLREKYKVDQGGLVDLCRDLLD